jgi:hypothetical protein
MPAIPKPTFQVNPSNPYAAENYTARQNKMFLVFSRLFGGGQSDEQLIADLKELTQLFEEDPELVKGGEPSVFDQLDDDCFDTMMRLHDLRESEEVTTAATVASAAYLKANGERGEKQMRRFFYRRMIDSQQYDDYIVCFCAAAHLFPIATNLMTDLFLHEGFLINLGNLMNHKWKSRKVETALLEMLRVASWYPVCLTAIDKYCRGWLEEIEFQPSREDIEERLRNGSDIPCHELQRHCQRVKNLAGLVLIQLYVRPPIINLQNIPPPPPGPKGPGWPGPNQVYTGAFKRFKREAVRRAKANQSKCPFPNKLWHRPIFFRRRSQH